MITYETTHQDGITYIHQIKAHSDKHYLYYRAVEIGDDRVKTPEWEVMEQWKLALKLHLLPLRSYRDESIRSCC